MACVTDPKLRSQADDLRDKIWSGGITKPLDAVKRIARLQDLRSTYQNLLQTLQAADRLLQTVDMFFAQPIISVRQVEAALCRYLTSLRSVM